MELSSVRDVLVIITTIATISGMCIKTLNKLFLETIKSRYKMIPGKQSIFDTILKSITYIIITFSIVFALSTVTYTIIVKGNNLNTNGLLNISEDIYQLIGIIIVTLFYYLIFSTLIVFITLHNKIIQKMERGYFKKVGREKILNNGSGFLLKYCINILFKAKSIGTKNVNIINIVVAILLWIPSLGLIISSYITGINEKNVGTIWLLSLIGIVGLISFVISVSFVDVIEIIYNNYVYEIVMEQELVRCMCFLEFDEYYLAIQDGNERYISKGKIREIKKVKATSILSIEK